MTRSTRDPRPAPARPREPSGRRGSVLAGAPLAVALSVVGLAVVALGTFVLASGNLPISAGGHQPGASGAGGGNIVVQSATPSGVVVVPTEEPGITVPGTLLYAKDGNIWIESNGQATQLTTSGNDSMPSFSPDGQSVFFIRTRPVIGSWPVLGVRARYSMHVPTVMRVPVAGGTPKAILDGLYPPGPNMWMAWIREPVLSPDGRTLAILSDLPNPSKSDVVLQFYNLKTRKLTNPNLGEVSPLGHQNPAWRPDGKVLAYVYNNRNGAIGAPQIYGYTAATGKARAISGPGYLQPSWSPDGKYLAVTKTSAYGTDVAIINASTGAEVTLLTNDGASWAPVWSPAGDQIAYLHIDGQVVDLRLVQLAGSYGDWTPGNTLDLTQDAGLDSISRPDWFVPASQMPAATPAPSASGGGPSGSPAGGTSPSPSPS